MTGAQPSHWVVVTVIADVPVRHVRDATHALTRAIADTLGPHLALPPWHGRTDGPGPAHILGVISLSEALREGWIRMHATPCIPD